MVAGAPVDSAPGSPGGPPVAAAGAGSVGTTAGPPPWIARQTRCGVQGIWMSYPIAFAAMLALQASYYRFVWRFKKIERLV